MRPRWKQLIELPQNDETEDEVNLAIIERVRSWFSGSRFGSLLLIGFWWSSTITGPAQEKIDLNPTEFKLAFLAKIPAYVTWPGAEGQLVVGILGKDPFNGLLDRLLQQKKVDNREVVVKVFSDPALVTKCHILFIPADQLDMWEELSQNLDKRGVLTIGERREFLSKGGVFNLSVEDRKLEINLKNAKKAGLEINSKLMKIAKIVSR